MSGFITLNRDIQKHWIWDDSEHLKAWCAILMSVNWERREIPCGTSVTICERGQCIRSQEQWAKLFGKNWDRSKVQRFFKLLKSASMIRTEIAHKALKLTVINYDTYQNKRSDNERNLSATCAEDERNVSTENNYNNNNHVTNKPEDPFTHQPIDEELSFEKEPPHKFNKNTIDVNFWLRGKFKCFKRADQMDDWQALLEQYTPERCTEAYEAIIKKNPEDLLFPNTIDEHIRSKPVSEKRSEADMQAYYDKLNKEAAQRG